MATFKAVVLKGNKRRDLTYSINIRVTHKRKSKYIKTNFVVTKDDNDGFCKECIVFQ